MKLTTDRINIFNRDSGSSSNVKIIDLFDDENNPTGTRIEFAIKCVFMQILKAILVDDELNSLQNLQFKIREYCPSVRVVDQTQNPEEAIRMIQQHKPDVIFLDIEMPRMSGFKMLDQIPEIDFEVIFITAYNHYAINAIRISAFDYLVKPVAIEDLQQTIDRLGNSK